MGNCCEPPRREGPPSGEDLLVSAAPSRRLGRVTQEPGRRGTSFVSSLKQPMSSPVKPKAAASDLTPLQEIVRIASGHPNLPASEYVAEDWNPNTPAAPVRDNNRVYRTHSDPDKLFAASVTWSQPTPDADKSGVDPQRTDNQGTSVSLDTSSTSFGC